MDWMDDPMSAIMFRAYYGDDRDDEREPMTCRHDHTPSLYPCPWCNGDAATFALAGDDGYCHHGESWGECDLCDDEYASRFGLTCDAHGELGCQACDPLEDECVHNQPADACDACDAERHHWREERP